MVNWKSGPVRSLALPRSVSRWSLSAAETVKKFVDNGTETRTSSLGGFVRVSVARRRYSMYTKINMKKGTRTLGRREDSARVGMWVQCMYCTGFFLFHFPSKCTPIFRALSTDMQEKLEEAKLRDIVRRRQTEIATRDLRGSA